MKGILYLCWRRILHHRGQALILVLSVAAAIFLPVTTHLLVRQYQRDLLERARSTPLVEGSKGNRFDLTLSALYLRRSELDPLRYSETLAVAGSGGAISIPLHLRFSAQNHVVAGTSPEYYEWKNLRPASGTLPLKLGDAVLGARVARELSLGPGDFLFSDPSDLYDISRPPALKMRVQGVLEKTGQAEDEVVFVDLKTAWILEGIVHGHEQAGAIAREDLVLSGTDDHKVLSPALSEYQEVTEDNLGSFHRHGDEDGYPVSSIIVLPQDDKAATLIKARVNAGSDAQMVVPAEVVDEMLEMMFKIQRFVDVISVLLIGATVLLVGLVFLLSTRLREREMLTLERIGCDRGVVLKLYAAEAGLILVCAVLVAAVAVAAATRILGEVTTWL